MSKSSFHKIIFRNSIVNTLRYLINYAIIFVLTPIIINGIGDAQYGLWALIFSLIGYAGILDLGVQQATIKLVSEYKGKNDALKLNEIISLVLIYFFFVGCIVALICWFVLPYFMHIFINDKKMLDLTKTLLLIIGFDVIFVFLGNVFTGISLGLHKYHLKGLIDIGSGCARIYFTIYVLNNDYGIVGLAFIALLLDMLSVILLYFVCLYQNVKINLSLKKIKILSLKEIFSFGGKIFIASTAVRINVHTTVILISYYLTTTMTAYYNVASRLVGSVQELILSLTVSLFPVFSELSAAGNKKQVWDYYSRYTRYFLLITMPAAIGMLVFGSTFISLWIGAEYAEQTKNIVVLLSLGMLIAGFQPLANRFMIGGGNVSFYTKITVIKSLSVLSMSIPLISAFELSGPPIAMLVCEFVYQFVVFFYLAKIFSVKILYYLRLCYIPVLIPSLSIIFGFIITKKLLNNNFIFESIISFLISILLYIVCCIFFTLNKNEKTYLINMVCSKS